MRKPSVASFASLLQEFFTDYLVRQRALSPQRRPWATGGGATIPLDPEILVTCIASRSLENALLKSYVAIINIS